jgi:hypothetical protein
MSIGFKTPVNGISEDTMEEQQEDEQLATCETGENSDDEGIVHSSDIYLTTDGYEFFNT